MKTIRILFYTDNPALEIEGNDECVCDVRRFIPLKLKGIANVDIQIMVRRGSPVEPAVRLTSNLLKDFHELWVFGFRNDEDSEFMLGDDEVKDIYEWMKTGGVMLTGDHSEHPGISACSSVPHDSFLAIGFTLGSRIPRAEQLRVWKGPPTGCSVTELEKSDTYNTQEPGSCSGNLDALCLQRDPNPQCLEPTQAPPHFLFTYDYDEHGQPIPITKFPDHAHVGCVVEAPDVFDSRWPARPPFPQVVAKGCDKRPFTKQRVYNLVVAYDGDQAEDSDGQGVGRIVADASFHHFINENLEGLPERDAVTKNPKPGTPLDEIAQFYANLAYWLAPKKLRDEIKQDLLFRAIRHIDVFETLGNVPAMLGRVARQVLATQVGAANLRRILGEGAENKSFEDHLLTYLITGEGAPEGFGALESDYLFGRVIAEYYEHLRAKGLSPLEVTDGVIPVEVIFGAVENTLAAQASLIGELTSRLREEAQGFTTPTMTQGVECESDESQS